MNPALILSLLEFLDDALPELEKLFTAMQNDLGLFPKAASVATKLTAAATALAAVTPTATKVLTPNGANGA